MSDVTTSCIFTGDFKAMYLDLMEGFKRIEEREARRFRGLTMNELNQYMDYWEAKEKSIPETYGA